MKIVLNPDQEIVRTVKEGLKQTGGYCPCRTERKEEYKCMCQEFREQIKDPGFEGYCHCMLYYKSTHVRTHADQTSALRTFPCHSILISEAVSLTGPRDHWLS